MPRNWFLLRNDAPYLGTGPLDAAAEVAMGGAAVARGSTTSASAGLTEVGYRVSRAPRTQPHALQEQQLCHQEASMTRPKHVSRALHAMLPRPAIAMTRRFLCRDTAFP